MKLFSGFLLKFEESSQKIRFRTQLIHKRVTGDFAVGFRKEKSKTGYKVQVKLALGAYFLKYPLRSCGVEECEMLLLKVLQKIDKPVHQIMIAELVGQDKGRQEVLLKEIAGRQMLVCSLRGRNLGQQNRACV
jgi:hypothetical protein